jgi:hypothetical protein
MKMKGPLMQGTECSSAIPLNEYTVAIFTGNYRFLSKKLSDDLI